MVSHTVVNEVQFIAGNHCALEQTCVSAGRKMPRANPQPVELPVSAELGPGHRLSKRMHRRNIRRVSRVR